MNTSKEINIVLIDDHKLFREGVKRILEFEPSFKVIAEGDDGTEAEALVKEYQPDVVLMDINMPGMNGVQATSKLVDKFPDVNVIIFSIYYDMSFVLHSFLKSVLEYMIFVM